MVEKKCESIFFFTNWFFSGKDSRLMWANTEQDIVYQTQWFDSRMAVIECESGELIKDVFVGQSPSHVMTAPSGENKG